MFIYVMVSKRQDVDGGDSFMYRKEIECERKVGSDDYVMQTLLVAIQAFTQTRTMLRYKTFFSPLYNSKRMNTDRFLFYK